MLDGLEDASVEMDEAKVGFVMSNNVYFCQIILHFYDKLMIKKRTYWYWLLVILVPRN